VKFGSGENKTKRVMPGMSTWVNLLDYSAAVLPVTVADKNIDVKDMSYKPMNAQDEKVYQSCEFPS
jgi:amidase